ncbi:MAG: hypothetical protein HQL51_01670 [Magnetococcales bacterium]|nr:hypothetical protein [Magnetococcales bacterium]
MPTNVFPQGFSLSTLPSGYWEGERKHFSVPGFRLAWLPDGYWQGRIVLPLMRSGPFRENGSGKAISGIVDFSGGAAAEGRTVRIHHRETGLPCATLTSGADGAYSAGGFSDSEAYYVVVLPFVSDGANAGIKDRVRGA